MFIKIIRHLASLLLSVSLGLLMVEVLLRIFDPLGAFAYFSAQEYLQTQLSPTNEGYDLAAGHYEFRDWSATISANHQRLTPEAQISDCQLAAVGDSYIFGWGVNDDETFVNRLAAQIPAQISNEGRVGYNITNVRRTIDAIHYDTYFYLIILNDFYTTEAFMRDDGFITALESYLMNFNPSHFAFDLDYENFNAELAYLIARGDVLIFAPSSLNLPQNERLIAIDLPYRPLSKTDGHMDAEGNRQVAALMLPYLQDFIQSHCP